MPRKEKKYHFIYKTTNKINKRFYIGMHSTSNLNDGYIGSGKKLWYFIKKYGKENFNIEILEYLPDKISLVEREREIVNDELLNNLSCMNLKNGGYGGFTIESAKKGRKATDKILKEKYGDNFISIINKKYRDSLTEDDKKELSNKIKNGQKNIDFNHKTFLNKNHTEITKRKIGEKNSIKQKGEKNSQFGTCWIFNMNNKQNKKINKNELDIWLKKGWEKGRKMKWN